MPAGNTCASLLEAAERCDSWPYPSSDVASQTDEQQLLLKTTLELRLEDGVTKVGLIVKEVAKLLEEYNSLKESKKETPVFIFSEKYVKFHSELNNEEKRTLAVREMVDYWREKDCLECLRGKAFWVYAHFKNKSSFFKNQPQLI
ncbi:hypothetical protein DSO57_1003610 [Entomophthora muscae]|uniref:Uncharacterized protein n=1 Tax=Entomophthora muscae TaxID=34485 RepID=A0ACC2TX16_9FUNG|nr:hypothetical protein DSO57_1003610 [Entomophthora muscae]